MRRQLAVRACVVLTLWFAGLQLPLAARAAETESDDGVRLVLVLVVDQLRRDRLDAELPGGLGELVRNGRVFRNSVVDHGMTETCPGHVVVATGRHPGRAGIPGNRTADPETGEVLYCVVDKSPRGRVLGHPEAEGRSPTRIRVDSLGDWMKSARPGTRVFSVSAKDRSAVALGGQRADAAYWFEREGRAGFATSRYYRETLPDWVREWNGEDPPNDGFLSRVPEQWDHSVTPKARNGVVRPDAFAAEDDSYSATTGHGIRHEDLEEFADRFYHSPFLDDATLDFARELVLNEGLGRGSAPDLLAIGLSATDTIGHFYGPESHEALDSLQRLDAALGEFLAFLDTQLGPGRVLVALTADHGVLPLPEWLEATGRSRCASDDGRADIRWMGAGLLWRLHSRLSPFFSIPRSWVALGGTQLWVKRGLARERGVPVGRVMEVAAEYLEDYDEIARVWTASEVLSETSPVARLYRNSYDVKNGGDLVIQIAEGCLLSLGDEGTTHGTPYLYDRAVPLLFYGPGVTPGWVDATASSVDVAPTLAAQLGVPAPDGLDGRVLALGGSVAAESSDSR